MSNGTGIARRFAADRPRSTRSCAWCAPATAVTGTYSLDNGATFQPAGTFVGIRHARRSPGIGQQHDRGPVNFKVGVYAFGGPDGSTPAVFAFDGFTASSVPGPASIASLLLVMSIGAGGGFRRAQAPVKERVSWS